MSKKEDFKRLLKLEPVPWDLHMTEEDLLSKDPPNNVLFGCIRFERVLRDLDERGIAQGLLQRGYTEWYPELCYRTPYDAQFRLWGRHVRSEEPQLLMDIRTHKGLVTVDDLTFRALVWEWISLQDPQASFRPGWVPLPGQDHPGLGQFRVLNQLMLDYVGEVDVDALVAVPEYFHNAVLYAGHMRFYEPEREGRFQAMCRDLLGAGMSRASRAVDEGRVEWNGPAEELWTPSQQVRAMAPALEAHFKSPEYTRIVDEAREQASYRLCES